MAWIGRPSASVNRWILLDGLPRSMGLRPVSEPPFLRSPWSRPPAPGAAQSRPRRPSRSRPGSAGQIPCRVHSSNRRQQVLPCANPIPRGTFTHGCPDRATYKIPSKHARSDTRGRPRPRRAGSAGNSTATRSHNASLTCNDTSINCNLRFLDIHRDTTPIRGPSVHTERLLGPVLGTETVIRGLFRAGVFTLPCVVRVIRHRFPGLRRRIGARHRSASSTLRRRQAWRCP